MDLAIDQFDVNISWYGESFSTGPLRLRAWIWPLINLMSNIGYVWQISLHRTLWGFEHRFGHDLGTRLKYQHSWVYSIIQLLSVSKAISHYHLDVIICVGAIPRWLKAIKPFQYWTDNRYLCSRIIILACCGDTAYSYKEWASSTFDLVYLCGVLWK